MKISKQAAQSTFVVIGVSARSRIPMDDVGEVKARDLRQAHAKVRAMLVEAGMTPGEFLRPLNKGFGHIPLAGVDVYILPRGGDSFASKIRSLAEAPS